VKYQAKEICIAMAAALLILTGAQAASGQNLSVKTGASEMDNATWVRLELKADQAYMSANGKEVWPRIDIQCSTSPAPPHIEVFFYTGLVEYHSALRAKIGDVGPFGILYTILPDMETLSFIEVIGDPGAGGSEFAGGPVVVEGKLIGTQMFAMMLATVPKALVEFTPYMSSGRVTAKFDTTGIFQEMAKHSECIDAAKNIKPM
jgi:hypothetical protein